MNKVLMSGYLSTDVTLRQSATGTPVASFTLAVRKKPRNADEKDAVFVPVVLWAKTAELTHKFCRRGSRVLLAGRIDIRTYEDAEGIKRWVTEVIADEIEFMDKSKGTEREQSRDEPPHAQQDELEP